MPTDYQKDVVCQAKDAPQEVPKGAIEVIDPLRLTRVFCFIDGFNLYHALNWFEDGVDDTEKRQYRKYKWLSLTALAKCYVSPKSQTLVGVEYFTTYTPWDSMKRLRHRCYVMAQEAEGVKVTFGHYKEKRVECKAACKGTFTIWQEKQTDVNIAVRMVELARQNAYDKALIISGDSDLIPAIKLIKEIWPEKVVAVVVPIGRRGDDIESACAKNRFKMTEDHLTRCKLPDKLKHPSGAYVQKPREYE